MSPSSRTIGALVALALIAVVSPVFALLAGAVLAVAMIIDAVSLRRPVEVAIATPMRLIRGVPAEVVIEVIDDGSASTRRPLIRQAAPAGARVDPAVGRGELHCFVTPSRRGHLTFPLAAVRIDGRLGLLRRTSRHGGTAAVPVFPDLPGAARLAASVRRSSFGIAGARRGELGIGTEFDSVREYVPNDDIRRVNWAATARTSHPMTNQFRQDEDRQVICVVDCGRLMGAPIGGATRLDRAVDAALAISLVADALGDRCGLLAFDKEIREDITPRRAGTRGLLPALSGLEVVYVESRFDLACAELAQRRRSLLVLFTDLFDDAAAASLVETLPLLLQHHALLIAGCLDPDVETAASMTAATPRDAYAAMVAFSMLEQQIALRATVRRAGAEVISSTPDELSGACVQAYLRLKSRNRL